MFAQDAVWAIRFAMITFYLLLMWFMMTSLLWRDGKAWAELIFNAYLAAAFFSAIIAILAALHALPGWEMFMRDEYLVRVKSTFKDPNVFGPFLVPAILICIRSIFFLNSKIFMHSGLLIVFLIAILITFSRGAWITLATTVCFLGFLSFLWNKNLSSFLTYILVGILAIFLIVLPAMYWVLDILDLGELFSSRLSFQRYDDTRFSDQYFLLEVFLDWPWGVGPGQSTKLVSKAAHSLYAATLAEYGLLGSVGLSMFFVATVWRGIRSILSGKEDRLIHSLALSIILG
ncbi:MAG: O-antigen ligase family protein, partial [Candidatus Tectomicrobia bacterium]